MSFKYRVERHSEGHYVLPRVDPMRVEVHAFLSKALYEQTDEALWRQIVDSASYDGVIGVYLMPDTHLGYGMIHCGSRGYGWKTANHFFYERDKLRGLAKKHRERSHLYIDEPLGRAYWAHHNSAANFAIANRHSIVAGVQAALREVYYEISHNLVQEETLVLPDGTHKRGFVHRKGATRAFPAGHPDLVGTRWEQTKRTPFDECGHVYKDLDAVLDVLEGEGIARVERRLYPVANIKGTD